MVSRAWSSVATGASAVPALESLPFVAQRLPQHGHSANMLGHIGVRREGSATGLCGRDVTHAQGCVCGLEKGSRCLRGRRSLSDQRQPKESNTNRSDRCT